MRAKRLVLISAVCSIVFCAGCGTLASRATTTNPPPFAGLRADFGTLGELATNKEEIKPAWMYWTMMMPLVSAIILADIPVSLVFDLPCLPADLKSEKKQPEKLDISIEKSVQTAVPSDGQ